MKINELKSIINNIEWIDNKIIELEIALHAIKNKMTVESKYIQVTSVGIDKSYNIEIDIDITQEVIENKIDELNKEKDSLYDKLEENTIFLERE